MVRLLEVVKIKEMVMVKLGGGSKYCIFIFTPIFGEMESNLTNKHLFKMGWFNHQLVKPWAVFFFKMAEWC